MHSVEDEDMPEVSLDSYVQWLIDHMYANGMLDDGCFTFPNGDTWYASSYRPATAVD